MSPVPPPHHQTHPPAKCMCNFSAEQVANALIDKLKDKDTAYEIIDVWGGRIDMMLGRGLRRFGFYVICGLLSVAAIKLGILEKVASLFKG